MLFGPKFRMLWRISGHQKSGWTGDSMRMANRCSALLINAVCSHFTLTCCQWAQQKLCLCPGRDTYAENHVAELLVQILSAVDYLHSRRVIHLDLKSDNMLVDDCNHMKIVDLGSAQSFTPGQPLNVEHIHGLSESKGADALFPV